MLTNDEAPVDAAGQAGTTPPENDEAATAPAALLAPVQQTATSSPTVQTNSPSPNTNTSKKRKRVSAAKKKKIGMAVDSTEHLGARDWPKTPMVAWTLFASTRSSKGGAPPRSNDGAGLLARYGRAIDKLFCTLWEQTSGRKEDMPVKSWKEWFDSMFPAEGTYAIEPERIEELEGKVRNRKIYRPSNVLSTLPRTEFGFSSKMYGFVDNGVAWICTNTAKSHLVRDGQRGAITVIPGTRKTCPTCEGMRTKTNPICDFSITRCFRILVDEGCFDKDKKSLLPIGSLVEPVVLPIDTSDLPMVMPDNIDEGVIWQFITRVRPNAYSQQYPVYFGNPVGNDSQKRWGWFDSTVTLNGAAGYGGTYLAQVANSGPAADTCMFHPQSFGA